MRCTEPRRITKNLNPAVYPDGLEVPCGKCLACRIKKRSEWSLRLTLESYYWERSMFLTLTYMDKYMPENGSLVKSDMQKFFKRLRKRLPDEKKIKHFTAGEYGDKSGRPHYHSIIFGLGLQEEDKEAVIESWPYCDWSIPEIRKEAFGLVEKDSIRYVAQYIDKKYSGDLAVQEYEEKGREPVFRLCSLGMGKSYLEEFSNHIKENLHITCNGVQYSLPRYYVKKLDIPKDKLSEFAIKKSELLVERFTGLSDIDPDILYRVNTTEYMKYHEGVNSVRKQRDNTLHGKASVKTRKL